MKLHTHISDNTLLRYYCENLKIYFIIYSKQLLLFSVSTALTKFLINRIKFTHSPLTLSELRTAASCVILINLILSTGIARGHDRGQIVPANFATSQEVRRACATLLYFPKHLLKGKVELVEFNAQAKWLWSSGMTILSFN